MACPYVDAAARMLASGIRTERIVIRGESQAIVAMKSRKLIRE
jgi:hypothetical protein